MARIFISYRREDSAGYAGRIYEWLKNRFDEDEVFMDVEGIEPGEDFVAAVDRRIRSAELVFAIIGKQWCVSADSEGRPRLDRPDDPVRAEIATAMERGIRVVPVLVSGATMPHANDLPDALAPLTRLNAFEVRDQFFEDSMTRLAEHLQRWGIAPVHFSHPEPGRSVPGGGVIIKKVCLVGATGVGKTSLVRRFVESTFRESYLTTIGVHISKKEYVLGATLVQLVIWDLAGEEEGAHLREGHLGRTDGVILVADGCRASSLDVAMDLRQRVWDIAGPVPAVLAVNKVDLYDEWQVKMEALEVFARSGPTIFTTSAKTGKAVEELFQHLMRKMFFTRS